MIRLFLVIFLTVYPLIVLAQDSYNFVPIDTLSSNGYVYGTVSSKNILKTLAFRKDNTLYVASLYVNGNRVPVINVSSLGYYKDFFIIGVHELLDSRKAWIMMIGFNEKPTVIDVIGHCSLNKYDYDFYFDMPSFKAPEMLKDLDGDALPEIILDFYQRRFRMLLEVSDKGLSLDYNSPYYLRMFNELKNIKNKDEYQFREYLLYGVISGLLSENDSMKIFIGQDSQEKFISSSIISKTVELKALSKKLGVSEILASYFSGDIKREDIVTFLEDRGRNSSSLMFSLFELEKALGNFYLDEVAFSDFILYFSDSIEESEFKKSAAKSLTSLNGDINSILAGYKKLNDSMKSNVQLSFEEIDIDIK